MSEIVKVSFEGDELEAVPADGKVHVVVRRVCEALGVDFSSQLTRLKGDAAIGVVMIATPSPGGDQDTACIELRDLPMWLAKIHPSKVKAAARPKLIAYQREAAEVLAEHFFGPRRAQAPPLPVRDVVAAALASALRAGDEEQAARLHAALGPLLLPSSGRRALAPGSAEDRRVEALKPRITAIVGEANAAGRAPSGREVRRALRSKEGETCRAIRELVAEGALARLGGGLRVVAPAAH